MEGRNFEITPPLETDAVVIKTPNSNVQKKLYPKVFYFNYKVASLINVFVLKKGLYFSLTVL